MVGAVNGLLIVGDMLVGGPGDGLDITAAITTPMVLMIAAATVNLPVTTIGLGRLALRL